MKRLVLVAAFAIVTIVALPSDAEACTCSPEVFSVSPSEGAAGVPTNAVVLVAYDAAIPDVALRQLPNRSPIALEVTHFGSGATNGRWLVARPPALAANSEYEVVVKLFDEHVSRFTTGATADTTAPAATLNAFTPETMTYPITNTCISSCQEPADGYISRVRLDVDAVEAALVAVEILDGTTMELVDAVALPPGFGEVRPPLVASETCGPRSPILGRDREYCARLRAYDVAGNETIGAPVCATTRRCKAVGSDERGCEPSVECIDDDGDGLPVEPPEDAVDGCTTTSPAAIVALAWLFVPVARRRRFTRRSRLPQ